MTEQLQEQLPSYLRFNGSKVSLDGLGLTDQRSVFLFVASNAFLQLSDYMANLIRLK